MAAHRGGTAAGRGAGFDGAHRLLAGYRGSSPAYGQELDTQLTARAEEIYELAGGQFNINSPMQLGNVLFEKLGLPHGKKTQRGYSTNADVLESLREKHPIIDCILDYRKLAKLKNTYVDGLIKVVGEDGRVHSIFKQTETRTGRISSAEPQPAEYPGAHRWWACDSANSSTRRGSALWWTLTTPRSNSGCLPTSPRTRI